MNAKIKSMSKKELWEEILALVNSTNFAEQDKELFIQTIQEYSFK